MFTLRCLTCGLALVLLTGCDEPTTVARFAPDAYPERLSEWGLLRAADGELELTPGVARYEINTPLFSDYARKLRTVWLPPGTSADYHESDSFEFPVGTVVSKTFFYPVTQPAETPAKMMAAGFSWPAAGEPLDLRELELVETRLLVRQEHGWDALPYVWRGDDAYLKIAGSLKMMDIELPDGTLEQFPYVVPTRNECASCHATNHTSAALQPIGLKARHLNRAHPGEGGNQLEQWQAAGRLHGLPSAAGRPSNADADDPAAPVTDRARAYLDVNCGHCHNSAGAADTSGLILDASTSSMRQLGVCKPPIAAGGGTGGNSYSIVPGEPDHSILVHRLEITDPGNRMPEIGRALVHREGVALVREWIASLDGECVEAGAD